MNIIVASAEGVWARNFEEKFRLDSELSKVGNVSRQRLGGLAGPNDNLQILLEWQNILKAIVAVVGTTVVAEATKDAYKNKAAIWRGLTGAAAATVKKLTEVVGFNRTNAEPYGSVTFILGIASTGTEYHRNIGIKINDFDEDEIARAFFATAAMAQDIKEFVEASSSKKWQNPLPEGEIIRQFDRNEDFSIAVRIDDEGLYVEYREIWKGPERNTKERRLRQRFPLSDNPVAESI